MADTPPLDDLSTRQQNAVIALLSEPTIRSAAQACGVPERTLYAWLRSNKQFKAIYSAARRAALEQAISRMQHYAADAVECVVGIMKGRSKPATRLAAAKIILDMSQAWLTTEDLLHRIEELERANQSQEPGRPARSA